MKSKHIATFQYILFALGIFVILLGVFDQIWLLVGIGIYMVALSVGTIVHLTSGKHNAFSKLPPDFNAKR